MASSRIPQSFQFQFPSHNSFASSVTNSSIGDSQEAIALFDEIAASQPLGDKTNSSQSDALFQAAKVANIQFTLYPNLENLEEAMSCVRTALADSSLGDNP